MTYSCYEIDNNVPITNASVQELLDDYATNDDIAAVNQSISNLNTAMASKANIQHDHAITDVDNLDQTLQSKLNVAQLTDLSITKYNINNLYSVYTDSDNKLIIKYGVYDIASYNPSNSSWSTTSSPSSYELISISNPATGNDINGINIFAPNMTSDNHIKIRLGKNTNTRNCAELGFQYANDDNVWNKFYISYQGYDPQYSFYTDGAVYVNPLKIALASGNYGGYALKLIGNNMYSKLTIGRYSSTDKPALFGYAAESDPRLYMKLDNGGTELSIYNDRVKISSNLIVNGTVSADNISTSMTILHKAPVTESIENYQLGYPVFSSGTVYKYDPNTDTFSTSTDNKDCIPSVKSTGTYREYLGIIVAINTGAPQIVSTTDGDVTLEQHCGPTVDFATHGDYYFHVNNSANYHLGDVLTFDGNIIADDTNINVKIMTSIVGKVTAIIDDHTVAVFKSF